MFPELEAILQHWLETLSSVRHHRDCYSVSEYNSAKDNGFGWWGVSGMSGVMLGRKEVRTDAEFFLVLHYRQLQLVLVSQLITY